MKTKFIALCAFALSLVALSSCNKADVETVEAQGQEVKLKVFSEETKAYLASGITNWSKDDYIYVLDQEGKWYNSSRLASGTVVEAEFTFPTFPANPTYALFVGANNSETLGIEDGQVTANLISQQSISNNNSFGKNANLTIGEVVKVDETTYSASLKNVCGLLKFSVPAGITSVKIEGNNGEILSGVVYIDYNEGQPEWTAKEGVKEVTVIPRKSGEEYTAGTYYACVLPQTFETGITVTLTDVNGYTAETKGSNPLALGRNKVVELPNLNLPKADDSVTLTFDFLSDATYPDGFPTSSNSSSIETKVFFNASNNSAYEFSFTNTDVYKATTGLVLNTKTTYMTFPVIKGKAITDITVFCGNSSDRAVQIYNSSDTNLGKLVVNSTTSGSLQGTDIVKLRNNIGGTHISKLILTYE